VAPPQSGPQDPIWIEVGTFVSEEGRLVIETEDFSSDYKLRIRDVTFFPGVYTVAPRYGASQSWGSVGGGDRDLVFSSDDSNVADRARSENGTILLSFDHWLDADPQEFSIGWVDATGGAGGPDLATFGVVLYINVGPTLE